MKVIVKNPGQAPVLKDIPNTLEALQQAVGGCIEMFASMIDHVCMVVNDEGKLQGLTPNFRYYGDCIVGACIFAAVQGEDLTNLSDGQIDAIMEAFGVNDYANTN